MCIERLPVDWRRVRCTEHAMSTASQTRIHWATNSLFRRLFVAQCICALLMVDIACSVDLTLSNEQPLWNIILYPFNEWSHADAGFGLWRRSLLAKDQIIMCSRRHQRSAASIQSKVINHVFLPVVTTFCSLSAKMLIDEMEKMKRCRYAVQSAQRHHATWPNRQTDLNLALNKKTYKTKSM